MLDPVIVDWNVVCAILFGIFLLFGALTIKAANQLEHYNEDQP